MSRDQTIGSTMAANGPAPAVAAAFFDGSVMHQRLKPFGHRFSYRVFSLMVDADRLAEADRLSALFSVNGRNLLSFHEADHVDRKGESLRDHADRLLADFGLAERAARILLVCYPRVAGFVFNPLSVYYAYRADGTVLALIYEVRNTFGERHTYVCPVAEGEVSEAGVRQRAAKRFHVSPFIPLAMHYNFRMLPPGREIRWRILETDAEGPLLAASFSGRQRPLSTATILALVGKIPFLTGKIIAGIHWEALKLWVKGAVYIPKPAAPPPYSGKSEGELLSR